MNAAFPIKYLALSLLMLALLACAAKPASATPPCSNSAILNSNGAIIQLRTGQTYAAFPGTSGRTMTWLPGDKVTICPLGGSADEITNTSRHNQTVKVLQKF